jgi:molybdopterin converting factor small subunit
MIRIKCFGHIKTSLGAEEIVLNLVEIRTSQLIEKLRGMARHDQNLGFTKFNTLVIVNDGEAFTAAADDRMIRDGDSVLLLPFSHGG